MSKAPKAFILPLHTGDYLHDTMHLSLEEHGAYLKLLMLQWRSMPDGLKADDKRLAIMLGVAPGRWRKLRDTIIDGNLFKVSNGFLVQKRIQIEWEKLQEKRDTNSGNGKRGGRPKSPENNNTGKANGSSSVSGSVPKSVSGKPRFRNPEKSLPVSRLQYPERERKRGKRKFPP